MENMWSPRPNSSEQEARLQLERQSAASVIEAIGSERFSQFRGG
jgi:hypothetical protein